MKINNNMALATIDIKDMFTNIQIEKVIGLIRINRIKEYQYKERLVKILNIAWNRTI